MALFQITFQKMQQILNTFQFYERKVQLWLAVFE